MHKCVDKENKVISLGPDCMLYSSIKDLLVYMCVYSWTKRSLLQYISLQLLKTYAGLLARPIKCKRKQDLQVMMKRIHSCTAVRDGARNGVGVLCCVLVHTSISLSLAHQRLSFSLSCTNTNTRKLYLMLPSIWWGWCIAFSDAW
jgi:hypothetical protein